MLELLKVVESLVFTVSLISYLDFHSLLTNLRLISDRWYWASRCVRISF
jgi:hypothetical protein